MVKKQAAAGVKERLSRERIVDCALALADAEGLEAVTIRRLAQDQGVTPMALYWHFKDKDRLLDGIAERLIAQAGDAVFVDPDGTPQQRPWDERLRDLLVAILQVLREHPAAAELVHTRMMLSDAGLEISERALGLLREAGFSVEQSVQLAVHALNSIVNLVIAEPGLQVGEAAQEREQRLRTKKAHLQSIPPDRFPNIVVSAEHFVECGSETAYFDLGLNLYIAGVRALQPQTR